MKALLIIFGLLFLYSCNKETATDSKTTPERSVSSLSASAKDSKNGTYLCKINGEDWYYTKASGLVYKDKKTGIQMATITFKKK
ncbi:hypothetical protein N7U66_08220 [Lacinutrix neustonica]|uniref:Lipoprotein n=1 Tax=Lacinutrix neustonica TaxID=2980107 RepID=A0A9E8MY18_9FLAO|nr:hypothetical protein [Lacinutrix neustonica]WAC03461.1 hypothetical protein N7U66_08220 [Lacinutrix neustonica]